MRNADFEKMFETSDEWIVSRTGMRERRYAEPHQAASDLATIAANHALERAGLKGRDVDCFIVATVTPDYQFPATACIVAANLDAVGKPAFDLEIACSGFIYALSTAACFIRAGLFSRVMVIGAEKLSGITNMTDRGTAILFGDGAGAAVLSSVAREGQRRVEWKDSTSLIEPKQRKALMFEQRDGMLRNVLTREVPGLAAEYAHRVLETVLDRHHLNGGDVAAWIMHAGGRDVLIALEKRFELDGDAFRYSAAMLREYGNLSSAFVYFVLEAALADDAPGGWWWLSSFGAGFSCHGALLAVE